MHQLKDIARRMDCHPRTAKRWWKKLDRECAIAGLPSVRPDVPGHGPHRWKDETFNRLIHLWETYYLREGTTPSLRREKFAGNRSDGTLDLLTYKPTKIFNGFKTNARKKRRTAKN